MNISQAVARVYAQAMVDLAIEQGNLGRIVDDLHAVQEVLDKDEVFRAFWATHRIERRHKRNVVQAAFAGKLDRPVLGLLHILVDKQRELVFDNIVNEFERYKDIREGRRHVHITTARTLGEDQVGELTNRLREVTGAKEVVVHERIDGNVLGGIRVKLGDRIIDGTVRTRLTKLRRVLTDGI